MNENIISACISLLESTLGNMSASDADAVVKAVTIILKSINK